MSKYYLTVLWGESPKRFDNKPQMYTFNSKAERDAFMEGVGEADGWNECAWHEHEKPKKFYRKSFFNWRE